MTRRLDERALRKKLLLARSTLHRLEIRKGLLAIGDALNLSGTGNGGGSSFSIRGWLFDVLLRRFASAPVARLLGVLSGVISFAQVLRIGTAITREATARPTEADRVVVERMAP